MDTTPSTAAQIIITVIPIVGIVFGSFVIFFYLYYSHKQKVLLIEKNLYKRLPFDIDAFSLFSGTILMPIGIILIIFFAVKDGMDYGLLSGLIPFSLGLGFTVFFTARFFLKNNDR